MSKRKSSLLPIPETQGDQRPRDHDPESQPGETAKSPDKPRCSPYFAGDHPGSSIVLEWRPKRKKKGGFKSITHYIPRNPNGPDERTQHRQEDKTTQPNPDKKGRNHEFNRRFPGDVFWGGIAGRNQTYLASASRYFCTREDSSAISRWA